MCAFRHSHPSLLLSDFPSSKRPPRPAGRVFPLSMPYDAADCKVPDWRDHLTTAAATTARDAAPAGKTGSTPPVIWLKKGKRHILLYILKVTDCRVPLAVSRLWRGSREPDT